MANNLDIKDANAAAQTVAAREYSGVKYPQIVDWTLQRLKSAASTNATSVKNAAGTLACIHIFNANAALRYLKLYNKASAPTVGTDVPVMTIPVPAGSVRSVNIDGGLAFATGIAYAMTTGIADTDTGAVAVDDLTGFLAYK